MDLTEEVSGGAYQSRTQSLRDKMKKRRQAIESLMTGEAEVETPLKRTKSDSGVTEENVQENVEERCPVRRQTT